MESHAPRDLLRYFETLPDPRPPPTASQHQASILRHLHHRHPRRPLRCRGAGGGTTDIERFARAKSQWLKTFLPLEDRPWPLPHGIPSHDTFGRVFAALDPQAFERCFIAWTQALARHSIGRFVAFDGKTLRRSFDHAHRKAAIHMISAWCADNQMVLGQIATETKSNEITALPKLLKLLDIRGATVTVDAMHCQKKTARQIVKAGGDYLLQVKANQATLFEEIKLFFDEAIKHGFEDTAHARAEQVDKGHGRVETRVCYSSWDIGWFADRDRWENLRSFVCVQATRWINGKTSTERRYYLSSHHDGRDAQLLLEAIRSHWGVENPLIDEVGRRNDEVKINAQVGARLVRSSSSL